jgi:ATP-dependent Lhr-like helicase
MDAHRMSDKVREGGPALRCEAVRAWFGATFPGGPTPGQAAAWPLIAASRHTLLVSPTGTGKTLAAFLGILDGLMIRQEAGALEPGLRCVYVSPLRSLGYDVERNLGVPLRAIRAGLREDSSDSIRVGVRTGDTSAYRRKQLRERPPHVLITTPESLSLMLSQTGWATVFREVEQVIVDEVHALVPTKRGADLAVSIERLATLCRQEPVRIGLSATCRPADVVARWLVGPGRECRIVDVGASGGVSNLELEVVSLLRDDEAAHRGLTYRRLLRQIDAALAVCRTTVVFANTRAFTEKITHDLRGRVEGGEDTIAAHHSALDAGVRRTVEARLKAGELRAVVTSTSLELGVDIGTADLALLVGLPGSVSRCLQRVGRAGHRVDTPSRGRILAATAAEVAGAAVTVRACHAGEIEPLRVAQAPLDVLCQQLIGMACAGECEVEAVFGLLRRVAPFESLDRNDFDACLAFLAGELASPPGAYEPEPSAAPRWTSPRLWRLRGLFGVRTARVVRWFRANVGTITSEESMRVVCDDDGRAVGSLEGAYAERLTRGDRFVLDGRALEFRRIEGLTVHARPTAGEPLLPRWSSDRQSLSRELASGVAVMRSDAAGILAREGPGALRAWLESAWRLDSTAAGVLVGLFEAQERVSLVPRGGELLIEQWPDAERGGWAVACHAPLPRAACEAAGRALAARLGRRTGRDASLSVADLGWVVRFEAAEPVPGADWPGLLSIVDLEADVLDGLDRGELLARRFRHVATTALMVLRNPEGGRTRVGGLQWVSQRLYPLVVASCPDHPLLRQTRREVLDGVLDTPTARGWLGGLPTVRCRRLDAASPFVLAWLDPGAGSGRATLGGGESLTYESPGQALRRLHARLMGGGSP